MVMERRNGGEESVEAWKRRQRAADQEAIARGEDPKRLNDRNRFLDWPEAKFEPKGLDDGFG
jgi:hypothetical protein